MEKFLIFQSIIWPGLKSGKEVSYQVLEERSEIIKSTND